MAYTKTTWANGIAPAINATNLNNIETGIFNNDAAITNLDNVTKYITATAGSNGDFKINISNILATNMILYVNFPAATTNTANARISIDDGTTYKNIKFFDSTQTIASEVESKKKTLYYDGTDFILTDYEYSRTNANGRFIKYKDGRLTNIKVVSTSVTVSSADGNIYKSGTIDLGSLAAPFTSINSSAFEIVASGTGFVWCGYYYQYPVTTTSWGRRIIVSGASIGSATSFSISCFATGMWN